MMNSGWTWKLLCWLAVACVALAFYSGLVAAAVVLAVSAAMLFVVDFRAAMDERFRETTIGRIAREEVGPAMRRVVYFALAVALLLAAQFVIAVAARAAPAEPISALCFICSR
jgi:hypothetical protein